MENGIIIYFWLPNKLKGNCLMRAIDVGHGGHDQQLKIMLGIVNGDIINNQERIHKTITRPMWATVGNARRWKKMAIAKGRTKKMSCRRQTCCRFEAIAGKNKKPESVWAIGKHLPPAAVTWQFMICKHIEIGCRLNYEIIRDFVATKLGTPVAWTYWTEQHQSGSVQHLTLSRRILTFMDVWNTRKYDVFRTLLRLSSADWWQLAVLADFNATYGWILRFA